MRNKVTIVGSGNVGATTAHWIANRELADIVLIDVVEGLPQGKALDLTEAAPVAGFSCRIRGTNSWDDTADSDVVVITAGIARRPGMSREDLVQTNAGIVRNVTMHAARYSPGAVVIVVTNPLDIMTYLAYKASGFEPHRVMGMSGVLDSTRLRAFIALELGVSFRDVTALVLGGHGDQMLPLMRYTYAGGIPVEQLIPPERLGAIAERTRYAGGEIVELLKTGSAFYAPGGAIAEMVEAILRDERRILPVAAYLNGEYGEYDVYAGVPAVISRKGVERIIEIHLTEFELQCLKSSISQVRETLEKL
ncbi:MAG: malate dehydrogenase [Ammonifex sp.]|jgi:malate dehydrogenase|nr:MAG: malate dehydrogenase [Ammonifex sp.]